MVNRKNEDKRKKIVRHLVHQVSRSMHHLITLLGLTLILVACGAPSSVPAEVVVQSALPTPTPEPTFTPSPIPTSTPQPSPTAALAEPTPTSTPTEPTPTPIPQSVLSGRILDQDTNQPVAGAKARVGATTATTDADGRYTLTGLPPGQYVLSVTHPDYDPGLSSIFALAAGQEQSLDLALYAPDASPYPKDPMLTNPLDPNGAPTAEDAERLAREQGMTGEVAKTRETKLSGEYLVNYRIGDEVRAAVADLNHEVWELTDDAGRQWWIIKVCGNLASPLPAEVAVATPRPHPLPPMAEVVVDELIVRSCALETCAELGRVQRGTQVEALGCLADGGWCKVSLPGGGSGWCTEQSLRQLAVAGMVPMVKPDLPTATPVVESDEGKIAFLSDRDHPNDRKSYPSPSYELYLMNSDGSQPIRITTTEGLYGPTDSLNWMPGYGQVYYGSGSALRIINLSDGSIVPWQLPPPVRQGAGFVELSPDGSKLAYAHSQSSPPTGDIFSINMDGTDHRQLTDSVENVLAGYPSWSPGGDKLAFGVQDSRPGQTLHTFWVMKADGTQKVKLADVFARLSAWSPSGEKIAFECGIPGVTRSQGQDICVISSDGTDLVSLTHFESPQVAWNPTWSPDGEQIAFEVWTVRSGGFETQVYVINADGTGLTQLTSEGNNCCPAWSR